MTTNRRQFIKQSLTAVGAGLVAPRIFFSTAKAWSPKGPARCYPVSEAT